jgi:hypothetical protein
MLPHDRLDLYLDQLLTELVADLSSEHTVAIVLAGSAVRGDATQYSDLDLAHIVDESYSGPEKKFHYQAGLLISVSARTLEWWRLAASQPERAIFLVPAMREARILSDTTDVFQQYLSELAAFTWAPLQEAANRFAGAAVAAQAETVHKVLSALVRGDGLFEPAAMLTLDMTQSMAVQRGVMVKSSASYMQQVRDVVGEESAWSNFHRTATNQTDEVGVSAREQAEAAVRLYRETVRLIEAVMLPDRRELAAATVAVVDEALGRLKG